MNILVIEDEPKVASFIKRGLEEHDYNAEVALDGISGLDKCLSNDYGLVILDVNIPYLNGYQVCKRIRQEKNVPILMLTALGSLENKVTGLDAGADDYLLKPFEFKELLARIRALSRRNKPAKVPNAVLRIADLEVNLHTKAVFRNNYPIDLTAKEYCLLEYLMKNQEKVLTRAEIAENVWNLNFDTGTNVIDVYINYLRKKIDKDFSPKLIHTLVGLGYVMKTEM